jgi:hypothetical protein
MIVYIFISKNAPLYCNNPTIFYATIINKVLFPYVITLFYKK